MPVVYVHRSPSGKAYVGWTSHPSHRWRAHVYEALKRDSQTPFHKAIRKYGPASFTHEILERMSTAAGAQHAERLWIKELGTFGARGYNATEGGEGAPGLVVSAEARAKLSAAHTGRKPWIAGRKHTAETRERMRAAHLGKPHKHCGHPTSEATKAKLAARPICPDAIARMAKSKTGKKHSPEHCAAIRAGHARRKAAV